MTFNYWQPYVIPTEQLENVGKFIDNHRWLEFFINGIFHIFNGILVILCCLRQWWFKNKKETIIVISLITLGYILTIFDFRTIPIIFLSIVLPLLLKPKNWLWIILTFIISNLFTILSFILEGFANTNNVNFIISLFMVFDYYIMLVLNYISFNLIRMKKEMK